MAERLGGTVINADSMQVYRELRILTARPGAEDEARAPHALYGFVGGAEAYSAGRYAVDAAAAIAEAQAAGRVPIVVGGTGLYFKALLEGLSPIPPADPQVRGFWRAEAARRPAPELHALLSQRDPEMAARLMPTDPQRIVRALEVLDSTGRSLADWQREPGRPVLAEAETERLLLLPPREGHGARIDARFDAMLAAGALEEVRRLLERGLLHRAAHHASAGRGAAGCPSGGGAVPRRGRRHGQGRHAQVRQAAADLVATKYDCVEVRQFAIYGKNCMRFVSFHCARVDPAAPAR